MQSALVPMLSRDRIPPNGEALASLLLGCPSLSIALVDVAALMGWQMKGMARRGTIAVSYQSEPVLRYRGGVPYVRSELTWIPAVVRPAPWNVPKPGFFSFTAVGLVLAVLGVTLSRKRRCRLSIAAFSVNALLLLTGYILLFITAT